jgi:hypothetical protein
MASTTGGHDSKDSSDDKALGASHDTTVKRPNRDKPLLQKISENSELKMSWIEQIEELEREGTVINKDNVIVSGPPRPAEAAEGGQKDPRIIIPNDPSKFPGFPIDMNHFETPAEFGLAVITFWAKWRKAKKGSSAKAKKEAVRASNEAEKQKISNQNENVVGANGRGHERDSRRFRHERRFQNWPRRDGWNSGRARSHERRRGDRRDDEDQWVDFRRDDGRSGKTAGDSDLDTLGFSKPKAAEISPDLILPIGKDIEVDILRERINHLPRDLLQDKQIIQDCRSASIDDGEICSKKNLFFWKDFMKDDFGLETFQAQKKEEHKKSLKRRLGERTAPLEQQHTLFQKQRQQQHKRSKQDRVPDEFLPFAVYVEKFEKNELVKLSGKEFDMIKAGIVNAYVLESFEFKDNLKDKVDRRLYNAEKGYATFYAKSEIAQSFIIRIINENLQLPGVKARGPKVESRPNLHVDFPPAFDRQHPETIIKQLIQMYAKTECDPVVRHIRPHAHGHGRTISVELPADKLALVASWGLDNDRDYFEMIGEIFWFRTTFKPSSEASAGGQAEEEVIRLKKAAKLTVVDFATAEPMEMNTVESNAQELLSATAALSAVVAPTATAASSAVAASAATAVLSTVEAPAAMAALAATAASVTTQVPIKPSIVSFQPSGPTEASEEALETKEDQEMVDVEAKVELAHLEFKKSLDQSALQLLEDYQSSNEDEHMSCIKEDEIKSASEESETEDGEVKDEANTSILEVNNSSPKTSTPVDLAKSLENEKHKARQLARKRLELSPPPSKVTDKVCTALNNPDPGLVPALVTALGKKVQAASNREAAGTETKAERPRRSCAINSYFSDNYVLGTEIVKTKSSRRSGPLSVTSKWRSGKGSDPTKNLSIRPFLKPTGASSKMRQNEALLIPKVAAAKTRSETKNLDAIVSQTLMQDFFPKN